MRTSVIFLAVLVFVCISSSNAGVILDRVSTVAKDVHEKVQEGAQKVHTGIKNLFGHEETTVATKVTENLGKDASGSTTPDPRNIIGSIHRCSPGEVFRAGDCRQID